MKTKTNMKEKNSSAMWQLLGKTIVDRPQEVRQLLDRYAIPVRQDNTYRALTEGVIAGLAQKNNKGFQKDLSDLLSPKSEDQFVAAIAGAVGSIANLLGGAQQNRAAEEQARSQTLASILAYKAQAEQSRIEQLKIEADLKKAKLNAPKPQPKTQTKTLLIMASVAVSLLILGLVLYQKNKPPMIAQPVTRTN